MGVKISELPEAQNSNDNDLFVIVQGNTTKKATKELILQTIATQLLDIYTKEEADDLLDLKTDQTDFEVLQQNSGNKIELNLNTSNYVLKATLKNSENVILNESTVDLPIESAIVNGHYDNETKKIIFTLQNGNTIEVPLGDLINGLQSEITSQNKLASDLVDDTNQINKFITASEKIQIVENKNNIEELQDRVIDLEETVDSELEDGIVIGTEITVNDSAITDINIEIEGNLEKKENVIHTLKGNNQVKISNRNQFTIQDTPVLNAYFDDVRTNITSSTKARMIYIPCRKNTKYTIQKILTSRFRIGYTSVTPDVGVSVSNITSDISSNKSYTYTTGNDAKYLCVFLFHGTYDTTITLEQVLNSLQIEFGILVNPYIKGEKQVRTLTFPNGLEMGKINSHKDKFIKQGNSWVVPNKIQKIDSYDGEIITTDYISTTGGLDIGATVYYIGNTDLTITDTTLIAELEELQKSRSYYGQTNIDVIAQDLEPNLILNYKKSNNIAIENLKNKSESIRIFKKVVCVGDSYTAGYIVDDQGVAHENNPEFSIPHYLSILTGNNWLNCGVSGASSKTWLTNTNGLAKAQTLGDTQAYLVGLMINDSSNRSVHVDVGTISDIGTENDTYYAYYSKIIRELNTISPNAKIFIETCPKNDDTRYSAYNQAVRDIYNAYKNTYPVHLIDLKENYNLFYNSLLVQDEIEGHYTAIGYEKIAEILIKIISNYIDNNITDFQNVAFIDYN